MGYAKEGKKPASALFSNVLGGAREEEDEGNDINQGGLDFVYPNGASLNVQSPSFPIFSSGPMSYPCNRPIAAVYCT